MNGEQSRRRLALIEKACEVSLSPEEAAELSELQRLHAEWLDTIQMPAFDELEKLEARAFHTAAAELERLRKVLWHIADADIDADRMRDVALKALGVKGGEHG